MASKLGDEIVNDVSFLSSSHGLRQHGTRQGGNSPPLTASIGVL
jgi:hypothetical protein